MDPIYIFLAILAIVLFIMGVFVGFLQKRITKYSLNNTLSMTRKIDTMEITGIKKSTDNDIDIMGSKDPIIIRNIDSDKAVDFLDEEII